MIPLPESIQRIREHLGTLHSDAELRTWFDPLSFSLSENGTLEVRFPHALFSHWFGKDRQTLFEREVFSALPNVSRVLFLKPGDQRPLTGTITRQGNGISAEDTKKFSFDTFIYNKKNEFPVSMAREVAAMRDSQAYMPFVICGKGSCGKTHLLRAMGTAMAEQYPSGVLVTSVEELEASYRQNPASFKRGLLRHKALLIDNGQNLNAYPDLQQDLVFIVEKYKEKNKPFVLSLDENLDQTTLNPKLRARLESGVIITVKKPDLDIRLRYAKAQCAAYGIHLKKEILFLLAQRLHTLPSIEGVIAKAMAFQENTGKGITLHAMEKILAGTGVLAGKLPTPAAIIGEVAESFSLSTEEIIGLNRSTEATLARQTAMYLCREILGVPYAALGTYFTGKNHATVIYACKKIMKILKSNKDMNKRVTKIRKKFLSFA